MNGPLGNLRPTQVSMSDMVLLWQMQLDPSACNREEE